MIGSGPTPQEGYFAWLRWLRRYGTTGQIRQHTRNGPPPPEPADGYWGRLVFHEFWGALDPGSAAVVAWLRARGAPRLPDTEAR